MQQKSSYQMSQPGFRAVKVTQAASAKDIQSLQSKYNQWRLANLNLKSAFKRQKTMALGDLEDRFLQVYQIKQQNFELQKLIDNSQKLCTID